MRNSSGALAAFAMIFAAIGAYFLWIGLTLETTVAAEGLPDGSGVVNLQMVHIQAMNIHLGIGAAIIATLFACAAAIVSAVAVNRPS